MVCGACFRGLSAGLWGLTRRGGAPPLRTLLFFFRGKAPTRALGGPPERFDVKGSEVQGMQASKRWQVPRFEGNHRGSSIGISLRPLFGTFLSSLW